MIPSGTIVFLLAHALKWPPAVRHYQRTLRSATQTATIIAVHIVDAYYDAVLWVDGKALTRMHDVLSRAGKAHATTGLAMTALQLGVTTKDKLVGGECNRVSLGPPGRLYHIRNRDQLGDFEAVVSAYLEAAVKAQLQWPTSDTLFVIFADKCLPLNDDFPCRTAWQLCRPYWREDVSKRSCKNCQTHAEIRYLFALFTRWTHT